MNEGIGSDETEMEEALGRKTKVEEPMGTSNGGIYDGSGCE